MRLPPPTLRKRICDESSRTAAVSKAGTAPGMTFSQYQVRS